MSVGSATNRDPAVLRTLFNLAVRLEKPKIN
jgi:hypothetical protein